MTLRRSRRGFTFIDMASSVAVALLLSAIVMPSVQRMSESQRVARAARVLATDLERGFSLASRIRQPVRLTCRCAAQTFEVRVAATDSLIYQRRFDAASGFDLRSFAASNDAIVSQSAVGTAEVRFAIGSGASARTVVLSTAGLARVLAP